MRLDFILMETPPKLITEDNIRVRLDHSKAEPDEINNIHFTQVRETAQL